MSKGEVWTFIGGKRKISEKKAEKYEKDLLQPYNRDGSLNKDFKKVYPNSEFVRRHYE